MSGAIAHEIRNPLTNISLSAEILRDRLSTFDNIPELESSLNIISRNYERIDKLVKDLLYSYKAEKRNFTQINLDEIVEEVLIMASDRILLKGILLEKKIETTYKVSADTEALKIALLNIVVNAIEAMKPSIGLLRISIVNQAEKVVLTIQDNGIGMSQQEVAKMFDPYYSKKPAGLGVGLANVKSILQNHQARIEVISAPGKGTSFSIFFNEV